MTPRDMRFWIIGSVLVLFNLGYLGFSLVVLKTKPGTPELVFHGAMLFAALSLFDFERAKHWWGKIVELVKLLRTGRSNGNGSG